MDDLCACSYLTDKGILSFDRELEKASLDSCATITGIPGTEKKEKRKHQNRTSNQKARQHANDTLRVEQCAELNLKPRRDLPINLSVLVLINSLWKCEQVVRVYNAYMGIQLTINVHQTVTKSDDEVS